MNQLVQHTRTTYIRKQVVYCFLLGLCVGIILAAVSWSWALIAFVLVFGGLLLIKQPWRLKNEEVAIYLNQQFPALENSAALLLRTPDNLNLLERLQVEKISEVTAGLQLPSAFYRNVKQALVLLLCSIGIWGLLQVRWEKDGSLRGWGATGSKQEKVLPGIARVNISVHPPAYTGKPAQQQDNFTLTLEEGAEVEWLITTTGLPQAVTLVFNDSSQLPLKQMGHGWTAKKNIHKNGFYQVKMDDRLSEFYPITTIPDKPPVVRVKAPASYLALEYGESLKVPFQALVTDDYGVGSAVIYATIASGSGEGVKFREEKMTLPGNFTARKKDYQLSRILDLQALHMQPGDELYFHVRATDSHQQETRSDIQIITLADTTELMGFDGVIAGVNIKPEYFRSQRQIIIETEELLRGRDSLARFKDKSNELGMDQKLLRLRYGKFLGEESETYGEDHDHEEQAAFGDAKAILEEFSHKHDNSEDATFFEPEVKQQLKTVLNEMWKAELQLRLAKPQEALPFEYKALRLLKDLQQKSRAYVGKTGTKTTPLKPEKRLTGEQDKISPAVVTKEMIPNDEYAMVRNGLQALELLNTAGLQEATVLMAGKAAAEPAVYLPAFEALQRINAAIQKKNTPSPKDIAAAQRGLQRMNAAPPLLPQPAARTATSLQQLYFSNLQTGKH